MAKRFRDGSFLSRKEKSNDERMKSLNVCVCVCAECEWYECVSGDNEFRFGVLWLQKKDRKRKDEIGGR